MSPDQINPGQHLWWRDGVEVREVRVCPRPSHHGWLVEHLSGTIGHTSYVNPSDLHETKSRALWALVDHLGILLESAREQAKNAARDEGDSVEAHLQDSDWLFDRCEQLGANPSVLDSWTDDVRATFIRHQETAKLTP